MDVQVADVIKNGETCVRVVLHRNGVGLSVQVKTHPRVEDFMRSLGNGEKIDSTIVGRHWTPVVGGSLFAYVIPTLKTPTNGCPLTVDALGGPLVILHDEAQPVFRAAVAGQRQQQPNLDMVNISYLRLVGTSEGIGVTFNVKGVFGATGLRKLRDDICVTCRQFYIEYMQPMDLEMTLNLEPVTRTNEMRY